ncbi:hypothetical protein [Brevibacillus borstelensis]|uniref:hypothetical protein n=1 Tax=Brevibacillus borstelensis TaxID=45462 RepID=UPI003D25766E
MLALTKMVISSTPFGTLHQLPILGKSVETCNISACFTSHAASTTVTLGVKKVTQAAELWCWAASSVSVLDYFGIKVTQSDFVEYVKGEVSNKSGNISEVMDGLDHYGLQSYRENNSLFLASKKCSKWQLKMYHLPTPKLFTV